MKNLKCIILLPLFLGCQTPSENEVTADLIPEDKLISLLIDLEIMEAYYEQVHKRPNLYKMTLDSASRRILADHNTSESALENTMKYYSAYPDSLFYMYEKALDSVNTLVIKNKKVKE